MRIIFMVLTILLLLSCSKRKQPLLSPNQLPAYTFIVDETTDSVFRTPGGAAIRIEKGSFAKKVELEVKEAYTMQDILLAGLVTKSNGQPLISGGMIYINTKELQDIKPLKPISVTIPTNYVNPEMQLYKDTGDVDSINWVLPDSLPETSVNQKLEAGKMLFRENCSTCHSIDKDLTGPSLRGLENRGSWNKREEIYKWVNNPARYLATNSYTKLLKAQFGSIMPSFPQLSTQDIDAILFYIKNEEANPLDDIRWISKSADSVPQLTTIPDTFCSEIIVFDEAIDSMQLLQPISNSSDIQESDTAFANFVDVPSYTFEINSFGWYNVDALVEGLAGTSISNLKTKITPQVLPDMAVYVFLPQYKFLLPGTSGADSLYFFGETNEEIPLFIGAEAYTVAYGKDKNGDFHFGITRFFIRKSQIIEVKLKKSTETEFLEAIKTGKLEGVFEDQKKQTMAIENYPCDGSGSISAPNNL